MMDLPEQDYIYKNNKDNTARFVLGTKGKNPLIVMSINPSIGSPTVDSPTIGTVRHIAEFYNYDSWIILCLYPERATHLDELTQIADPALIEENNKVIEEILSQYPDHKIWAAWGTHYQDRDFFRGCLESIAKIAAKYHDTWMSYGPLEKSGNPRYALYIDPGWGWFDFDVQKYLEGADFKND